MASVITTRTENLPSVLALRHGMKAVVISGSDTIWEGNASLSIALRYAVRPLARGELGKFAERMSSVYKALRSGKDGPEAWAELYDTLKKTEARSHGRMIRFASSFLQHNQIIGAGRTVAMVSQRLPVFLSTGEFNPVAEAAENHLRVIKGHISNTVKFDGDVVSGIEVPISSAEKKLKETESMVKAAGFKLSECAVVGDGALDRLLMEASGLPVSSINAKPEIIDIARINLRSGNLFDWKQ